MRSLEEWLFAYELSHRHPINVAIHNFAVPAIVVSVLGFLSIVPFPISLHPLFNWASVFVIAVSMFALFLSIRIALGFLACASAVLLLIQYAQATTSQLAATMSAIFVIAWILQFIGHHIEGKRPLFFQDLQFLLIGPLWIIAKLYRKANIPW